MRRPNTAGSTANSPDIVADTDEALRLVTSGSSNNVANSYETHLRKRRYVVGVCFLLLVVVLWVSSNFLTSALFYDDSYSKPYFITYTNTSTFTLYLLPISLRWLWRKRSGAAMLGGYEAVAGDDRDYEGRDSSERPVKTDKLGTSETFRLSAHFCAIWFTANYFSGFCFKYTTVASGTILSCTSSIWTLFLGSMLGVERFTKSKLLAILISFCGIAIVSMVDTSKSSAASTPKTVGEILLGDFLSLVGAILYAAYTTLLKHRVGDESRLDMQLFFGFVGLINLVTLWPGLVILHLIGVEPFELPPTGHIWLLCSINAIITLVSDYCWAMSMLLTSPVVSTVGLGLTIPLAMLGEIILGVKVPGFLYWLGAIMVCAGFLLVNLEESQERRVITEDSEGER